MAISIQERFCADAAAKKKWIIGGGICGGVTVIVIIIVLAVTLSVPFVGRDVLKEVPLIDGHNDLPWNLYQIFKNDLSQIDLRANLTQNATWTVDNKSQTDLPRLKQGMLGGQFWVAYANCSSNYRDAVSMTLDQIDVIKRLVKKYPEDLEYTTTADGITEAFKNKKIASLIGVEGGHSIDSRMGNLRMFYELGVRYMTLTHNCELPWANSHLIDLPENASVAKIGLTAWGKEVVLEMNRLGMIVDLSHVSKQVMSDALQTSKAPVIFSHSSSSAVFEHTRNAPDDILLRLKANKGILMVNFFTGFISPSNGTIEKVIEHLEYVRKLHESAEYLGLGGDFDGTNQPVKGLEDVSKYPDLFDRLAERGWTRQELKQLAGENLIRVFKAVEAYRDSVVEQVPYEKPIPHEDLQKSAQIEECRSDFKRDPVTNPENP